MRARRGSRPSSRAHRVTERDVEILAAVARMRAPTAPQLARLFVKTPSALHRRVRALYALGLVRVHALSPNDPNVVTLTAKGAELVERHGVAPYEIHAARAVLHRDPHAELIGDLRVGVVLMGRRRGDIEVECFLSDFDMRRAVGRAARDAYIPDALVALRVGGAPLVLAYEIDRGFEPGSELGRKAAATVALSQGGKTLYGFAAWRPVLLASSERRLGTLTRHIVGADGGALWAGGLLDTRHMPDAPVFALAADLAAATTRAALLTRRLVPERS